MAKIEADPVKMREFQRQLKKWNGEMEQLVRRLDGHLNQLGDYWRDSEYAKFQASLKDATKAFDGYLRQSDNFQSALNRKIVPLEKYRGGDS